MTEQITIKLNEERFRVVLDDLKDFFGEEAVGSYSDLSGKCILFCHRFFLEKKEGKTESERVYGGSGRAVWRVFSTDK